MELLAGALHGAPAFLDAIQPAAQVLAATQHLHDRSPNATVVPSIERPQYAVPFFRQMG